MSELIFHGWYFIYFSTDLTSLNCFYRMIPFYMTLVDFTVWCNIYYLFLSRKSFQYFGLLEQAFFELFSTRLSAELIYSKVVSIFLELIEDDIDNNERKLKYIISSFSVSQTWITFIKHWEMHSLWKQVWCPIPKLMKYFDRIDPKRYKSEELKNYFILKSLIIYFNRCRNHLNKYIILPNSETSRNIFPQSWSSRSL